MANQSELEQRRRGSSQRGPRRAPPTGLCPAEPACPRGIVPEDRSPNKRRRAGGGGPNARPRDGEEAARADACIRRVREPTAVAAAPNRVRRRRHRRGAGVAHGGRQVERCLAPRGRRRGRPRRQRARLANPSARIRSPHQLATGAIPTRRSLAAAAHERARSPPRSAEPTERAGGPQRARCSRRAPAWRPPTPPFRSVAAAQHGEHEAEQERGFERLAGGGDERGRHALAPAPVVCTVISSETLHNM